MSYLIETSLPPLHRDWDINDMVGADNLEEVQQNSVKYLNNPDVITRGNNLYIYSGQNGTGKTRTAYWLLYKLHEPRLGPEGRAVIYPIAAISYGEYITICEDKFSADAKAARQTVMTVPILLLDDVSAAFGCGNLHTDKRHLLLLMTTSAEKNQ